MINVGTRSTVVCLLTFELYPHLCPKCRYNSSVQNADRLFVHPLLQIYTYMCIEIHMYYFGIKLQYCNYTYCRIRAGSRLCAGQWETSLQSNAVSHWLGANLESALSIPCFLSLHPWFPSHKCGMSLGRSLMGLLTHLPLVPHIGVSQPG